MSPVLHEQSNKTAQATKNGHGPPGQYCFNAYLHPKWGDLHVAGERATDFQKMLFDRLPLVLSVFRARHTDLFPVHSFIHSANIY